MPSRSSLPGKVRQKKFCKALGRLGFEISTKGGKGSHIKATWKNQKSITIPSRLDRDVLYYIIKEIEKQTEVTWQQIEDNL